MNTMAAKVAQCFAERFGAGLRLYYSPGRINLIGEHVDYNDGFVMPAAIDKGVYYAAAANGSQQVNLYSVDFEEAYSVALADVAPAKGWPNYLMSVVHEFLLLGLPLGGFDAVLGATVPRGSGLSSSAAVEGGLAFAINDIFGLGLDRVALAQLCQRAEQGFPGVQCGIMDQFANMMGKQGHVVLLDCRDLSYQHYPLQLDGHSVVLLNSGVHHSLASTQYNLRRQQCAEGLAATGHRSFRQIAGRAALAPHQHKMEASVWQRCVYVVDEIARAQQAAALLQQNELRAFGQLMFATHWGLSQQYEVSCPELDFLVVRAQADTAVAGARMMGGGFGGCTINIVASQAVDAFVQGMATAYADRFGLTLETYSVALSDGVGRIG
jgi:galactokinase